MHAGTSAVTLLSIFASLSSTFAQQAPPRERFQNADVQYGWVSNSRGDSELVPAILDWTKQQLGAGN